MHFAMAVIVSMLLTACGASLKARLETDVQTIAGQLADMVEMIHQLFKINAQFFGIVLSNFEIRIQHPSIQCASDYPISLYNQFYLIIRKLPLARHQ